MDGICCCPSIFSTHQRQPSSTYNSIHPIPCPPSISPYKPPSSIHPVPLPPSIPPYTNSPSIIHPIPCPQSISPYTNSPSIIHPIPCPQSISPYTNSPSIIHPIPCPQSIPPYKNSPSIIHPIPRPRSISPYGNNPSSIDPIPCPPSVLPYYANPPSIDPIIPCSSRDSVKLQVIIDSANDLRHVGLRSTMNPFVSVSVNHPGATNKSKGAKTFAHKKGGKNPTWDYIIEFQLPELGMARNQCLVCEIKHRVGLFDRRIGHTTVPLGELVAGDAAGEKIRYPVVAGGKTKGEIIISHKLTVNGINMPSD